jgi:UrcA family protein
MKIAIKLLAAVALLSAGNAFAQDQFASTASTVTIQVSDLNLATPDGQETLNRRINGALHRVCPRPDTRVLMERTQYSRCMAQATSSVARQMAQLKAMPVPNATFANANSSVPLARLAR